MFFIKLTIIPGGPGFPKLPGDPGGPKIYYKIDELIDFFTF